MNPEAFRYFHVFPLMVRPHARTEDGNNLLHSELLFKNWILLPYKSSRTFPEDECTCIRYTLKPPKGTQPFKYMIAQFRSNMELTLVGEAVTVCINTEEIGGDTRESNRAFDVENILSFPNIDDIAIKVKEYIRVLMQLRSRPLIYSQSYPLLTCII